MAEITGDVNVAAYTLFATMSEAESSNVFQVFLGPGDFPLGISFRKRPEVIYFYKMSPEYAAAAAITLKTGLYGGEPISRGSFLRTLIGSYDFVKRNTDAA